MTGNFNVTTNIDLTGTTDGVQLIRMINFPIGLSLDELSTQINQRLRSIITDPSTTLLSPTVQKNQQYPFYYRPSKKIFNLITNPVSGQFISSANMAKLTSMVKISSADKIPGYGLVLDSKLSPNIPFEKQSSAYAPSTSKLSENTVALLGGTKLYLLSNETSIEGKSQINFNKGIYGFEQNDLIDDIEPNTSSMVRGEELIELLNLIVRFLVAHVHPVPGTPPVPVATDGTQSTQILFELQNAVNKILNPNIRIN